MKNLTITKEVFSSVSQERRIARFGTPSINFQVLKPENGQAGQVTLAGLKDETPAQPPFLIGYGYLSLF